MLRLPPPPTPTLFPYTTLFRSHDVDRFSIDRKRTRLLYERNDAGYTRLVALDARTYKPIPMPALPDADHVRAPSTTPEDRKSTRLNSSHVSISYAVFCLKKKKR